MKICLRVEDAYTYITQGANPVAKGVIRDVVKARPDGYQFMPRFRAKRWDGYISLYESKEKRFPTGLLTRVLCALDTKGIEYDVEYVGGNFLYGTSFPLNDVLRPYQLKAARVALQHERCVLHMATNAGKTYIIAYIIQVLEYSAVVVVPTRALLLQTADRLEELLGIEVGRIGADHDCALDVTVVTIASLGKWLGYDLKNNRALVVDECHHSSAPTLFDNLMQVPASYRIGVSGTPLTYDDLKDLKLMGATGPVVYTLSNADLIEDGYSAKPEIKFVSIDVPKIGSMVEYDEAYRQGIAQNEVRNSIIGHICQIEAERGPILVLTNWIEHLNEIMRFMPLEMSAMSVTGQSSTQAMRQGLDWLREGQVDILVATDVFGEGIDVPSIATLILAGGGKTHIKLLQRIGRGLRVTDAKDVIHVWDFLDDTSHYLFEHSEARYQLYKAEGFDIELDDSIGG